LKERPWERLIYFDKVNQSKYKSIVHFFKIYSWSKCICGRVEGLMWRITGNDEFQKQYFLSW